MPCAHFYLGCSKKDRNKLKEELHKGYEERTGCYLALGREDFGGGMTVAFKHPRNILPKGSPAMPFLLLLQIEPLPKGALDFRVHFPCFPFLNQLCFCHPPGYLWQQVQSVGPRPLVQSV